MRYRDYFLRRVLLVIPTLFGVITLIFVISRIIPGDPARLALGPWAKPEQVAEFRHILGLDKPIVVQYFDYLIGLFKGDFGLSLTTKRNVLNDLLDFMPASFELVTTGMALAIIIGVPIGVIAGTRKDKWPDHTARIFALSGVSLPQFWAGIILQLIFAYGLHLVAANGRLDINLLPPTHITGMYTVDSLLTGNWEDLSSSINHLILPAFALSLASISEIVRMTRSSMVEELGKDHVLAARVNRIPEFLVVYKYALKSSFTPIMTLIGLDYGFLLGNAFLIEMVFLWPGLARYGVNAIIDKDFNSMMGVTLVIGIGFVFVNLIIDLLYGYVDPRVRLRAK